LEKTIMIVGSTQMLRKGAVVRVRRDERDDWTIATVALASDDGKSIGLLLDGPVRAGKGFIVGALPLLIDYDARTITGPYGDDYQIEMRRPA
jgi:hypothetical protein